MAKPNLARTSVITRAVVRKVNQFLIIKRGENEEYNPKKWELPGGRMLFGTDLVSAVEKIVATETSLVIKPASTDYICHSRFVSEKSSYYQKTYIEITIPSDYVGGVVKLDSRHKDSAWVTDENVFDFNLSEESRRSICEYLARKETVDRVKIFLVAYALIRNPSGKILMLKRSSRERYSGVWDLPGGKLKSLEALSDNLQREVFEETNMVVDVVKPAVHVHCQVESEGIYKGFTYVNVLSEAAVRSGEVKLSKEHDKHGWFTVKETLKLELPIYLKIPLSRVLLKRDD